MMVLVNGYSPAEIECQVCHEMTNHFTTLTIGVPSQPYDTYIEITGHNQCIRLKQNDYVKNKTIDLG
jgi:hypothetical protein